MPGICSEKSTKLWINKTDSNKNISTNLESSFSCLILFINFLKYIKDNESNIEMPIIPTSPNNCIPSLWTYLAK